MKSHRAARLGCGRERANSGVREMSQIGQSLFRPRLVWGSVAWRFQPWPWAAEGEARKSLAPQMAAV